ncbi:MAG: hypothetical protein KAT28_02100 [Candidatus Aenigmarchaeota archaeon]|nr:hypothetical protein [Candidatus Aenigmarchaeota archaeon]
MTNNELKGISPVIATILMVMITVGLVAFSYSWFTSIAETGKKSSDEFLTEMEKSSQSFNIATAYECTPNVICFAFQAYSKNKYSISPNNSHVTAYLNDVPVVIGNWTGGIGGTECYNATNKLSEGEICYGYVNATSGTCNSGDMLSFRIEHSWGAKKTKSILCK